MLMAAFPTKKLHVCHVLLPVSTQHCGPAAKFMVEWPTRRGPPKKLQPGQDPMSRLEPNKSQCRNETSSAWEGRLQQKLILFARPLTGSVKIMEIIVNNNNNYYIYIYIDIDIGWYRYLSLIGNNPFISTVQMQSHSYWYIYNNII